MTSKRIIILINSNNDNSNNDNNNNDRNLPLKQTAEVFYFAQL